jgi:hypothetical protein
MVASGSLRDRWIWDMYLSGPAPALAGTTGLCLRLAGTRDPVVSRRGDGAAIREAADAAVTLWWEDPYCSDD